MANEDPIKPILEQIGEILNFFHNAHKEKKRSDTKENEPSEDFSEKLQELEIGVEYLRKTYELALQKTGVTEKEVVSRIQKHPDYLKENEKKLLQQIATMRIEAMAIRDAAEKYLKETELRKKKQGGKRKKSIGRDLGTRKGWKKM